MRRLLVAFTLLTLGVGTLVLLQQPQDKAGDAKSAAFSAAAESCRQTDEPWQCLNTAVDAQAPVLGVEAVLTGLTLAVESWPADYRQNCHSAMHLLGRYAGQTMGNVDDALALGSGLCEYGYWHGVVEGYALVTPNLAEDVPDLCAKVAVDDADATGQCTHGLGHAIAERVEDAVPTALDLCRLLSAPDGRYSCMTGVFMDWSDALTALLNEQDGRESPVKLSEPFAGVEAGKRWHICRQFDDEAAGACVFWLASSAINNDDGTVPAPGLQQDVAVARIQAFTQWCVEAFNARNEVITSCYRGVGQFIGGLPGLPLIGGWPAVVDLCRSAATIENTNGCLQAAYRIGAQFDPTLTGACEAWAGLPEKQEQCDLIATIRQAK